MTHCEVPQHRCDKGVFARHFKDQGGLETSPGRMEQAARDAQPSRSDGRRATWRADTLQPPASVPWSPRMTSSLSASAPASTAGGPPPRLHTGAT